MEAWGEIVGDDLVGHGKDFGFFSETDENPLQGSGYQSVMIQLLLLSIAYPGFYEKLDWKEVRLGAGALH